MATKPLDMQLVYENSGCRAALSGAGPGTPYPVVAAAPGEPLPIEPGEDGQGVTARRAQEVADFGHGQRRALPEGLVDAPAGLLQRPGAEQDPVEAGGQPLPHHAAHHAGVHTELGGRGR